MTTRDSSQADREFAEFMHGNAQRLCRVGYLLTGDAGRAEELTQDALARTYRVWKRVRQDDAYAYTRRVLVNLHIDWWRRRRRERVVAHVPERAGGDPTARSADRDALDRALRDLTRRERGVIVLRYYLDLTEAQTADELGISVGTVKSTTSRALKKLRVSPGLATSGEPAISSAMEGLR
ncbi:MAG: SigE family RNA polymerase sigma factor [Micromonosporaceae bacterium]|nr:SigE family RNA polymerase sigma factor [Micromonosporaceae bacterium]